MRELIVVALTTLIFIVPSFSYAGSMKAVKAITKSNGFPQVELIVNVKDRNAGKGVYNLNKSDFTITEGGDLQEITSFIKKGEGKVDPIDIVFVFDETGSMQDEINAVRDNSIAFANFLKSSNMDYRLALITFSDSIEKNYGFVKDVNEFKSRVGSIRAFGGGDKPENALDALAEAKNLKFREGAEVVFILITDAPYHSGDKVTKRYMLPLAKKIKLEDIKVYPIAIKIEQYQWMARETGGTYFSILENFSSIIESLAVELTAQYRIEYNSTNSSFDNTKRNVEIKVYGEKSAKTSYISGANIKVSSQLIEKHRPSDAYKAENMIDGNKNTAWSEGASGHGIGEWVKFGFDEPKKLKVINIVGGYAKTDKIFKINNSVKKVKIIFSDGKSQIANLKKSKDFQKILIDRDTPTNFVKLEIMDVYKGTKYKDTCISEINFEYKD